MKFIARLALAGFAFLALTSSASAATWLAEGRYNYNGTIFYSNGSNAYCNYANWVDYLSSGGSPTMAGVNTADSFPTQMTYGGACQVSLPANPFGLGSNYLSFQVNDDPTRATIRAAQIEKVAYLGGIGAHVRIWCNLSTIWYTTNGNGPAECVAAVQKAHDMGLVPVVTIQDAPYFDASSTANNPTYNDYANAVKYLVSYLPTPNARNVWIEMANEPNFTNWWPTNVCSYQTRAHQVAQQTYQTILKIRELNNSHIKILGPSLSPYGDYDPVSQYADGLCHGQTGAIGLSSVTFLHEMKLAQPLLFAPTPMYDAWNTHAYPDDQQFHLCGGSGQAACPPTNQMHGLTAYRAELQEVSLPSNFPVMITEAGYPGNNTAAANYFVYYNGSTGQYHGAYPDIWLSGGSYNNVKAVIGYIIGQPTSDIVAGSYNWMDPWTSIAATSGFNYTQGTVVYQNVYWYRKSFGYMSLY